MYTNEFFPSGHHSCLRCGLCEQFCPTEAISLNNELSCSGTDCEIW